MSNIMEVLSQVGIANTKARVKNPWPNARRKTTETEAKFAYTVVPGDLLEIKAADMDIELNHVVLAVEVVQLRKNKRIDITLEKLDRRPEDRNRRVISFKYEDKIPVTPHFFLKKSVVEEALAQVAAYQQEQQNG